MRYDLYYLTHQSLALDLAIVWETIKIVLRGRDPSGPPATKSPLRNRGSFYPSRTSADH
jgi:hypothetical protein